MLCALARAWTPFCCRSAGLLCAAFLHVTASHLPRCIVPQVLDIAPEEEDEEDGAAVDLDAQRKGKCVVLKTSTRQTIFLPVVGLVRCNAAGRCQAQSGLFPCARLFGSGRLMPAKRRSVRGRLLPLQ